MKKKNLWLIVAVIVVIGCIFLGKSLVGSKPFKDLGTSEIQEMTVYLIPPEITFAVKEEELIKIVQALNSVTLYGKDNSTEPLAGQGVVFTITKKDGTVAIVEPLGSLIVIDGVRYHAKNEPNQKLSYIANNLESLKEG